jgi:hypothetical protein
MSKKRYFHELSQEEIDKLITDKKTREEIEEEKYDTLQKIVDQLEFCNFQTEDGLHWLKDNSAFIVLKNRAVCVNKMLPDLSEVKYAKEKYCERKQIEGWYTNLKGVGIHFQDGVNWALNFISKRK